MEHDDDQIQEQEYIATLSPRERQVYAIAHDHLGASFHAQKTRGFIAWLKSPPLPPPRPVEPSSSSL